MQALEVKPPTLINFSPLSRRYTLEEFWALPEREDHARYDLIGGYLFMVPPPHSPHERLDSRLTMSLVKFILDNNIDGEVLHPHAPIYRRAEASTYLEPDMMFVSSELREKMGTKRTTADIVFEYLSRSTVVYDRTTKADTYLLLEPDMMYVSSELRERMGTKRTTADIVFEILSKSTANYDRTTKADTYLLLDVRELWLVDRFTETIEVRHASTYEGFLVWETYIYSRGELARSRVLEGWEVSVDEIFAGLTE
jgi:Uma2 family endonuclease